VRPRSISFVLEFKVEPGAYHSSGNYDFLERAKDLHWIRRAQSL
jgi:hypothetical protein